MNFERVAFCAGSLVALLSACGGGDSPAGPDDAGGDVSIGDAKAPDAARDASAQDGARGDGSSDDAPDAPAADTSTDANMGADSGVDAADSGAAVDASFDAPVVLDSGQCNTLVNGGPAVPETNVPQAPPTATGGTINPGLYYLTAWQVFTGSGGASGPTGNTRKTAFFFETATYFKVTADNGLSDENDTRTWSTAGTTLTSNQTCPTVDLLTSEYSVAGNQLTLIAFGTVLTFAHQ